MISPLKVAASNGAQNSNKDYLDEQALKALASKCTSFGQFKNLKKFDVNKKLDSIFNGNADQARKHFPNLITIVAGESVPDLVKVTFDEDMPIFVCDVAFEEICKRCGSLDALYFFYISLATTDNRVWPQKIIYKMIAMCKDDTRQLLIVFEMINEKDHDLTIKIIAEMNRAAGKGTTSTGNSAAGGTHQA